MAQETGIYTLGDRLHQVCEWLLIALLAFMPLAFGAVEAWSEMVVVVLSGAILICYLLGLVVDRKNEIAWSWAYVPIALFILVAVVQLQALPASLVETVSPNTAAIKSELLGDLPQSDSVLQKMTLSFYPHATKHDLRLVLSVAAVFFVVVNLYRSPERIKRLLAAIAVIGGALALLAIAQVIADNGKIYWTVPTGHGHARAGTFINHSHYAQFMNLCIGAAMALAVITLREKFKRPNPGPAEVLIRLGLRDSRGFWLLAGMILLGTASIFLSLSRGGVISMLIAAAFTTLVIASIRSLKGHGWIMVALALGAFLCILYVGFDAVYDRLATLGELQEAESGRMQILKDIASAWKKFPVFGTGLGTHSVVYPMFDRSTIPALAAHAENEYAQAAEETGLAGLIPLLVFGASVWICYARCIRKAARPMRLAACGLGFGLLAVLIHSLSDFGQHLPANAMLSAVFCGLLIALARDRRQGASPRLVLLGSLTRGRKIPVALLAVTSVIWLWAVVEANDARAAEDHWKKARLIEESLRAKGWAGTNDEYKPLILEAQMAADRDPDNVEYKHWLGVYRWQSISRFSDPNTGGPLKRPETLDLVRRIIDELNQARVLCPTYGATYCVIGQLERFTLGLPAGADRIQRGYELAPCDATACFVAGYLDAVEGRFEDSVKKLSRAVELRGSAFGEVAAVYIDEVGRPDLALEIAGDDVYRLSRIANLLADYNEHETLAEATRDRVIELMEAKCKEPHTPASVFASLARIYKSRTDQDKAIEYYRRALDLDYGQVYWRLNLARLLADAGQIEEAMHEARVCLRLRPQYKPAENLLAMLAVQTTPSD